MVSGRAKETDMMTMSFVPRALGLRKSGAQSRGALCISWLPNENQSSSKAVS
jgi:hypothetical protein